MTITNITSNSNGHPRKVIHFLAITTEKERATIDIIPLYELALKRARKHGGKRYHCRAYGGGIAFVAWNDQDIIDIVNQIKSEIHEAI